MKIVLTTKGETWESPMDARFGRSEMFLVYDDTSETFDYIKNDETETMEHGAGLQTAKKILKLDPDVIITGNGAGGKALDILRTAKVKIYTGAGEMSVQEAYEACKNGKLSTQN